MAFTLETKRRQRFDFMRSLYDRTEGSEIGLVYVSEIANDIRLPELETEIIALYLSDEGLIRVRMRNIISITHIGVDEVETALQQPDQPTEHFPALQAVPLKPVSIGEARRDRDTDTLVPFLLPPKPLDQPIDQPGDEFAAIELKHICDAIGLDPREVSGETGSGITVPEFSAARPVPVEKHGPQKDFGSDVRALIEHAQAAAARNPEPLPAEEKLLRQPSAAPPRTRARSPRPANRQAVRPPIPKENELADVLASLKLRMLKIRLAPDDIGEAQAEIGTAIAQLLSPRPKLPIVTTCLETLLSILGKADAAPLTKDVEGSLQKIRAFLSETQV